MTIIHTHLQHFGPAILHVSIIFINSIAEISANSADLGLGIMPGMNGMMVGTPHLIPPPGLPQLLRQRMSDLATHRLAHASFGAGGVVHPHPGAYPGGMIPYPVLSHAEHLAMAHRHHQYQQAGMMAYHQSHVIHDDSNALNAAYGAQPNPSGKEALPPSEGSAKLETPVDDDVPMMAMYKSKKKSDKRAKKAEKRKRKPKLVHKATPQLKTVNADPPPKVHDAKNHLVHHNLFNGGFDGIGRKISSPLKGESIESVKEKSEDSPPSSNGMLKLSSSPHHKMNGGSVSFSLVKSELTTEENSVTTKSLDEIASMIAASRKKSPPMSDDKKPAAKNGKKSSPSSKISLPVAKKHRVDSDKSSNDEDNCEKEKGNPDSGTSKIVKVTTDCKRDGPHGDVLALLFNADGSGKSSSAIDIKNIIDAAADAIIVSTGLCVGASDAAIAAAVKRDTDECKPSTDGNKSIKEKVTAAPVEPPVDDGAALPEIANHSVAPANADVDKHLGDVASSLLGLMQN